METTSTGPAAHECDHCGAPLPPADETGTRQCSFCKTTYRTPPPKAPRPDPEPVVFTPAATFTPVNASSTNRGCGMGVLLIVVIVVAAIAVPLWLAATDGGFSSLTRTPMTLADVSPAILPGEPSGPAAFLTIASRYDSDRGGSVYSLVKSDGVSSEPVWSTDLEGQASGLRTILTDGTSAIRPAASAAAISLPQ